MNTRQDAAPALHPGLAGMLALELAGDAPARAALGQADAARLAACVGRDLAARVPEVRALDLCLAAAHFDPAEALRPGWPLHRRLAELQARAPGREAGARIIAFGADAAGDVPLPLVAEPALRGGPLRIVPFLLHGEEGAAQRVGEALESTLLDTGMAQADTALLAQEAFGARIEHARYLTVHDLAAMTAMQYEHIGLAPLWPVLETALLSPGREALLDSAPEPLLRYANGEARMALFAPAAWRARYQPGSDEPERLRRLFEHFEMRQRQLAAVLEAHGLDVVFVEADASVDARAL